MLGLAFPAQFPIEHHIDFFKINQEQFDAPAATSQEVDNLIQTDKISKHLIRVDITLESAWLSVTNQSNKGTATKFESALIILGNQTHLIRGVSVTLCAGQVTAIFGPSGAGKSSLLKLLSGRARLTRGALLLNGKSASIHKFRSLIGTCKQKN